MIIFTASTLRFLAAGKCSQNKLIITKKVQFSDKIYYIGGHWNTVLLLWHLSTKCNADYLQVESREAVVVSVVSNGSFTYFTTCIEGGAGRVNDSVALHDGNVGLDNLQLRNTTTTNDRQTTVVKLWVTRINGAGQKWAGHKTVEEKKKEKWAHSVLAEKSVVSCRGAELARFTEKHLKVWSIHHQHTPLKGKFQQIYYWSTFYDYLWHILWSVSRTPSSQSGCRQQCAVLLLQTGTAI